jgi:hypothetical protein
MVEGVGLVALCAARSVEKPGDIYLDDAAHAALVRKFRDDFASPVPCPDCVKLRSGPFVRAAICSTCRGSGTVPREPDEVSAAVEREESNNPNREWWDRTYGPEAERCY